MAKKFVPIYDLTNYSEEQRQQYVEAVCEHLDVPSELNLVRLIWSDEGDGARHLVAYALKGATDIIRDKKKITTENLTSQVIGGSIAFTATGKDKEGRQEIAVGSAYIDGLKGKSLDNAIMTSQTRSTRRMTLQFVGGGVLDESEVNTVTTNINTQSTPLSQLSLAPQPTVPPSNEPGKDITPITAKVEYHVESVPAILPLHSGSTLVVIPSQREVESKVEVEEKQLKFEAEQAKLRQEAIDQLNTPVAEAVQKKRRGRTPGTKNKAKVDFGPSEPPVIAPASEPVVTPVIAPEIIKAGEEITQKAVEFLQTIISPRFQARLTPEQVKPYRQRLFKIINDSLEPAGFAPKEGMGNSDKMKAFAGVMFSDVTNFNELTAEQWEKYLSYLENHIKTLGAIETVKKIEDSIGI